MFSIIGAKTRYYSNPGEMELGMILEKIVISASQNKHKHMIQKVNMLHTGCHGYKQSQKIKGTFLDTKMMDAACNSPVPSSQEGEHDPIQQESCNPPINVESTPTPQDVETGQTLETTAQTEAQMEAEIDLVKKDKRKSIVWKHFTLIKVNEQDKAQCNYCKKLLGGSSRNGTKHLHTHMDTCVKKMLMERSNNSKGQTCLMPKVIQGKQELGAGTYNAENARKELAQAIIMHDYPLSIVDHVGFKRYSAALQPLFQVPSRNTIKKEIFKVYEYERSTTLINL